MKVTKLILILTLLCVVFAVSASHPTIFGFQMKVTNSSGSAVTTGNVTINISDGDNCNGNFFTKIYTNNFTSNGIIDVMIGDGTPTISMNYNQNYYLCVFVTNSSEDFEQIGGPYLFRGGQGEVGPEDVSFSTGNPFNQFLNTTNNVTFWNITSATDTWCNSTSCYSLIDFLTGAGGGEFVPYSGATSNVLLGVYNLFANNAFFNNYVNFTYLRSNYGGLLDASGSPWYLSGVDLEIDQDLKVNNTEIENDLTVGNNVTVVNGWCNSTDCYAVADFLLDTDTAKNPFDQSLNTTDNITHDSIIVTHDLIVSTASHPIKISEGKISFDPGFNDVWMSVSGNVFSFFARHEVDKDKWVNWLFSPSLGAILSFGVNTPAVFYSETRGAELGTSSYPFNAYLDILFNSTSDGSDNITMTEILNGFQYWHNHTLATYNLWNTKWSSTYNETYLGSVNNASYLATHNSTYDTHLTEDKGIINWTDTTENLETTGNVTASYGFFTYVGSLASRITKGWFTNIDVSVLLNTTNLTVSGLEIYDNGIDYIFDTNGKGWCIGDCT